MFEPRQPNHDYWLLAFEFGIRVAEILSESEIDLKEMRKLVKQVANKERDLGNLTRGFPDSLAAGMTLESYQKAKRDYKEMIATRIELRFDSLSG